jgi:hypothetical protein
MCGVLKILPGMAVIAPFVIFNGTAAHEDGFMREEERKIWVMLEQCLLLVLQENAVLLRGAVGKQADLGRTITRSCRTMGCELSC